MATLADAVQQGLLIPYSLPEWEPRSPIRPLYLTNGLIQWTETCKELSDPSYGSGNRTLLEHLIVALCDFRCSALVHYGDVKPLMPTSKGVWRLCPPGLYVYGWCPGPHSFAAVAGILVNENKKTPGIYAAKRQEVLGFVKKHGLADTIQRGDYRVVFPR